MKKVIKKSGFTLIEMIVVITIIGVLMSVMVFEYGSYIDKSEQVVFEEEFRHVINVLDIAISSRKARTAGDEIATSYRDFTAGAELEAIYNSEIDPDLPEGCLDIQENYLIYERDGRIAYYDFESRVFTDQPDLDEN